MQYMGSKNRIAKQLLHHMLKYRLPGQMWVEPFVGGGNMIDKVDGPRLGADANPYVIEALKLIRDNPRSLPDFVSEQEYNALKKAKKVDGLTGYVGFELSFGGKWFDTYRRDFAGRKNSFSNSILMSRRAKVRCWEQSFKLRGVVLQCCGYKNLVIPKNSLVYCDPPYTATTGYYQIKFDHEEFWAWVRKISKTNKVFVSEYSAPKDFKSVVKINLTQTLNSSATKNTIEKLFTLK